MTNIKVYSKANCMPCKFAKQHLAKKEVEYEEIIVDTLNDVATLDMLRTAGYKSFPVIVYGDFEKAICGFSPKAIDDFLEEVL